MKEFLKDTMGYIEQHHQRSNSESGFAADKKNARIGPIEDRTGSIMRYSVSDYGITCSTGDARK